MKDLLRYNLTALSEESGLLCIHSWSHLRGTSFEVLTKSQTSQTHGDFKASNNQWQRFTARISKCSTGKQQLARWIENFALSVHLDHQLFSFDNSWITSWSNPIIMKFPHLYPFHNKRITSRSNPFIICFVMTILVCHVRMMKLP